MSKRWVKGILILILATMVLYGEEEKVFNGLYLNLGNLFRLSHAKSLSISPENFTGEKGKGGLRHRQIQQILAEHFRKQGKMAIIEAYIGRNVDILVSDSNKIIAIEIQLSAKHCLHVI